MKKDFLILFLLLGIRCFPMAQCVERFEGRAAISWSSFYQYPFPDVMALIGEPDTFLFCCLPSVYYEFEEDNAPICVNLLVYKKDGCWRGTTIQEYQKKKVIEYQLTDTVYLHRNLDMDFSYVIDEMKKARVLQEDISGPHTYILTKDSAELYITLTGSLMVNLPRWMDIMPDLSSFVSTCLFKTYTTKVLKKYRCRR